MDQLLMDLLFILCFFLSAGCCALVYIEWLKYRFKIIFQKNPIKIQPVFVEAEPVYETNEVVLVV